MCKKEKIKMARGKAKSGKAKLISIASGKFDGIYWAVRQKMGKEKCWGIGVFTTEDEEKHQVRTREFHLFDRVIKSLGMCLACGDLDFRHFDEHHIDKTKLPDFTITLCANHHRELHWNTGTLGCGRNG